MGHFVEALIVLEAAVPMASATLEHTRPIPLRQGLHIIPITNEAFDALRLRFPDAEYPGDPEFWKLSGSLAVLAAHLSRSGPVAYIETEYFGGTGSQSATVWSDGAVQMPPTQADSGPINAALRLMGVRVGTAHDEFEAVGLGSHRSNDRWLERAT